MHPTNRLRLLSGIPIDPLLEGSAYPGCENEEKTKAYTKGKKKFPGEENCGSNKSNKDAKDCMTEGHKDANKNKIVVDSSGKKWKVLESMGGEGDLEKYRLQCMETGKEVIKKARLLKDDKELKEEGGPVAAVIPSASPSEDTATNSDNYSDGDVIFYNNGAYVVVLSDKSTDMVGIIPAGLADASPAEKNRAVEMVKPDPEKFRKPTEEELDVIGRSKEQLAKIDDDMAIEFRTDEGMKEFLSTGEQKGKEYGKKLRKKMSKDYKLSKVKNKRGSEDCEVMEGKKKPIMKPSEDGLKKGGSKHHVAESTHNYAPGNQVSHQDTTSQPLNSVAQGEKQWANSLDPAMVKSEIPNQPDSRTDPCCTDEDAKVKVPAKLKTSLKEAINKFRDEAEKQGNGHTARENMQLYLDTANAYEEILGYLNEGTVAG